MQNALESKVSSQKQLQDHAAALARYLEAIDAMLSSSNQASLAAADAMTDGASRARWISAVAVLVVLALSVVSFWLLRRSIVLPLRQACEAAAIVARGDFTVRGAQPGEALGHCGARDQGADRRQRGKGGTGAALVATAGSTMDDIVRSVRQVTAVMSGIHEASSAQSQQIAQVSRAVEDLDQMTQQNAALVEEGTAAAHSLSAQSQRSRRR